MGSFPAAQLPSLLVFGPQTELPSPAVLEDLRKELSQNPSLSTLRSAVHSLPQFWQTLITFDPELRGVPGEKYLSGFREWVAEGGAFPHHSTGTPNVFALPVTVVLQITQYVSYINSLGVEDPHRHVLDAIRDGGVQGFCVGLLGAIALAVSHTEADIATVAGACVRLAVTIGAYVDQDGRYGDVSDPTACVALRWRDDDTSGKDDVVALVRTFQDAYISSINDLACVTITAKVADISDLKDQARERGYRVTPVSVEGRFHSMVHSATVDKLTKFSIATGDVQLPPIDKLQVPIRSTVTGEPITEGSLVRIVLENTLSKPANWYGTLQAAVNGLSKDTPKIVGFAGFGNHVPASLVQSSGLQVHPLGNAFGNNGTNGSVPSPINVTSNGSKSNGTFTNGTVPDYPAHSIAIVGMSGRFPGADSLDELWNLLLAGKVMAQPAPVDRLNLPKTGDHSNTKWWGNFLNDPDRFDNRFFKKSSREAIAWDPQQRILLEVVYEALESAGYFGAGDKKEPDDYGCYIGAVMNNYYDNVSCHPATAYATIGTSRCFLSGCMSHYFGWTGPSLTIDTACSSSLVAINTACRAIWSGECSRAIAGGTNMITSPFDYQNLHAAGFLSPSGQCKPFDVGADGYCRGEGVGVIVLKRLEDAVREKDDILGVIVGSAANQNYNASHITVPHSTSQVELYRKVMASAGVDPKAVSYVEAHGTGTGVGDPVECRSIREAFAGSLRDTPLHFSSIKGNIGHTEATAGIAGLIKVLLMMRHGKIPAQASHNSLNPKIPAIGPDKMVIPRSVTSWDLPTRIAMVNSYGAAGSNSAALIRQYEGKKTVRRTATSLTKYPFFLSAASSTSLSMYGEKLEEWIRLRGEEGVEVDIGDLAFGLADRANHGLTSVFATTVGDIKDLEAKLTSLASGKDISVSPSAKPVIFVFGGQESDFIGLSEDVYQHSTLFRHHLDSCNDILIQLGYETFYPTIFQRKPIPDLVVLHSALFAIQYASAKSWIDGGLEVSAVVGHSFGQLTALCISGTLSLEDALRLVAGRASIMLEHWGDETGSMVFLQTDESTTSDLLRELKNQGHGKSAEIACYNGPKSHVVVGTASDIDALESMVTNNKSHQSPVRSKRLQVTHGFHSKFTESLLPHLSALAHSLEWKQPAIHLETCDQVQSISEPDYRLVAHHTRRPVYFQSAISRLAKKFPQATWIEAGRGSSVMQLVRGSVTESQGHSFFTPQLASTGAEDSLINVTLDLWKAGYSVQFWPFHRRQRDEYKNLSLPSYQFEKTRHWLGFTGRGNGKEEEETAPVTETPKTYELLTFLHFGNNRKTEAIFNIAPESDRFKTMLGGHVMAGQSLAPASLYYEVAARAALFLAEDTSGIVYVPTTTDLTMKSPIGLDTNIEILLHLTRLDTSGSNPSWSFSITTQAKGSPHSTTPFEQSTGRVHLTRRDDAVSSQLFARFETLTGVSRCDHISAHPDAEGMAGNHVYRAFNHIVHYGVPFRGIKQVSCLNLEATGVVRISVDPADPADQRLTDTPMTDSFMQFAGFLVNYFNNPSLEDVFVCSRIERIEMGGRFDPDAGEWIVYSNMRTGGEGGMEIEADAYVFEKKTGKMVMGAFGFGFSRMSQGLLARMLKGVNKGSDKGDKKVETQRTVESETTLVTGTSTKTSSSHRQAILKVLNEVTDVPLEDLKDESTLEDLGVDSLMATEVLNDVRSVLGLTIDLTTFLFFANIKELIAHVDEKMGVSGDASSSKLTTPPVDTPKITDDVPISNGHVSSAVPSTNGGSGSNGMNGSNDITHQCIPSITSAFESFQNTKLNYDRLAMDTKAAGFWKDVYPDQSRLVLAYVVEAFANLGCDLKALRQGDSVPDVQPKTLSRHKQLVEQLYRVLEDGRLISTVQSGFIRTATPVDRTPAETLYRAIIPQHPESANVHELVKVIGTELAPCLSGEKDGLQLIFGDRKNKATLEDMYANWPLLRTPTLVLGDFLLKAFTNSTGSGKFRILEIGAGTGGTTKYIINHLQSHGIDFEYTFTDISSSLVAAARKTFKSVPNMRFEILDIERPPSVEQESAYNIIIATNCIHATRNLNVSLTHLHRMLRPDGALTLVEITRNMFWLDIVVGLFEGWWLFADGRTHALIDETRWAPLMKAAGFQGVAWSDGKTPEASTVRVIAAFPTAPEEKTKDSVVEVKKTPKATIETVVYKKIGDLEVHADVYCPIDPPAKKLPIALMIHGGSHILFSRKDIRPAQTRLLLEQGFLPVSLDHRLCPETRLVEGPMVDVCDALYWSRHTLPYLSLNRPDLRIDGEKVVVVGWSSGGQLAMSLAWTAPARGLRPPEAILAFYCPTNYEDNWWTSPIQPHGASDPGTPYDVLAAIQEAPITNYGIIGAWEPLSDPRILTDQRARIVLHINWKAQTLPVIISGLPPHSRADKNVDYDSLPLPSVEEIRRVSPRAQIEEGRYNTPTFMVHGTEDELIPWEQSEGTYKELIARGVEAGFAVVEGAPHICDLSSSAEDDGWKAVLRGYAFLRGFV
ncbi:beta-ketoacyl synthase domain-containing protein [Dendryphion nanum]|uniref:Beta-ketoacyl synthase domain-containing protein n=1 Tax=Dendryphion nanum TaxID=256645 RepID=A0A9P9EEW9_9PLEO|nr:beta-ketoacyl synthase domain-containing protein [Dendryphion nanum]